MTAREFFGDWNPYIDYKSLRIALSYLSKEMEYYPKSEDVFKAFTLCGPKNIKAVFVGQDPYPQKDVATGVMFGNRSTIPEDQISPSLKILKEAAIDYTKPHLCLTFDNTLESWGKQGILMLNSSLTVKPYVPGSHSLYWRPFISYFLTSFSNGNTGMLYVLFGNQAHSFENCINKQTSTVIKVEHPASLARKNAKLPQELFNEIQSFIYKVHGTKIEWFHEDCF